MSSLELQPQDNGAKGFVRFNDAPDAAAIVGAPQQFLVPGRGGENVVEANLRGGPASSGQWRFDFRGTDGFEPGSLRVDSGRVLAVDGQSVVFQVRGSQSPPIRFRYRLAGR